MIKNNKCKQCDKSEVCKISDILNKFSEDAKNQLGVDITMDKCENYSSNEEE